MSLIYMRASDNVLFGGTVSGGAATTYDDDWLVDGRGTRPAKATSGSQTWSVTAPASGFIDLIVVHCHNIDAARAITIGGGVSAALVGPAARTDGIPVNPWGLAGTGASTASLSIAVSGNSAALTIGELLAGRKRSTTEGFIKDSMSWGYLPIGTVESQAIAGSVPHYDRGLRARWIRADWYVTPSEKADLQDFFEGTRNDYKPAVIIPFDTENDAWVGRIQDLQFGAVGPAGGIMASIEFHEWPRKRWS